MIIAFFVKSMYNTYVGDLYMVQKHLSYEEMTNLGCFYTPQKFISKIFEMVFSYVKNPEIFTFVDTSCGYGNFLHTFSSYKTIGCDIDNRAIEIAKQKNPTTTFHTLNSLSNFDKSKISLKPDDPIIIVGNPPYNDTTSKIKNGIKNAEPCEIDPDLKTRDLGLSFMLSYNKIKADYVAILHPLSYMIKHANFNLLKPFFNNYVLLDHYVINSQEFNLTSKTSGFPIIIALYKRDNKGTIYSDILNTTFKTIDNKRFDMKHDYIGNYISKYPSKWRTKKDNDILFYTMRDINALKRSKTFIEDDSPNAIYIDKNKFNYYCYVDNFKDYIENLPYYFGNMDVFIDNKEFLKIQDVFITRSITKHPFLRNKISHYNLNENYELIDSYFRKLFRNF